MCCMSYQTRQVLQRCRFADRRRPNYKGPGEGDKYRFLGKAENCNQLDSLVYEETRREYLRRLSVIWTSPLTIPRKIQATNVFANTMMEYYILQAIGELQI